MKINESIKYFRQIQQFNDIYEITKNISSKKDKGDLFEFLVYYMFKFLPQLNQHITDIWLYNSTGTLFEWFSGVHESS